MIGNALFITVGAGYYLFMGTDSMPIRYPSIGYVYGNIGLAYEWRSLRLDVGYFLTENARAQRLFPYPTAHDHFASTLSWRF